MMPQAHFKQKRSILSEDELVFKKKYLVDKTCKHRDTKEWCHRNHRPCAVTKFLFTNQ